MTLQRIILDDCGCAVLVEHESADRLVTCPGGGIPPDAAIEDRERCKGGVKYCVTAEMVSTVVYTSHRVRVSA